MQHDNMKISRLMVHSQQVEDSKAERNSKHAKRARSFDGSCSKGRLKIQEILGLRSGSLIKFFC